MRTVVDMNPWNWAAFWILGKGYQAQGRSYEACDAFSRAYAVQEQNAEVAQEYMVECLNVGKTKKAVDLAHAALQLRPDEAGLKANLALCLLIDAQVEIAQTMVTEAVEADPNDETTKRLKQVIEEVRSGKRPQPRRYADLKSRGQTGPRQILRNIESI
ncbi:MAG: hypothetical protein PHD01_01655 [Geobacteraceae bacterium]|nr:hypothetical protein [Geobacteraceae bacterium]